MKGKEFPNECKYTTKTDEFSTLWQDEMVVMETDTD